MAKRNPPSLALFIVMMMAAGAGGGEIGMNWGRKTSHRMLTSMVADILLQNGIRNLKIFSHEVQAMEAFSGTGISLTVTLPTAGITLTSLNSPGYSRYWLNDHARVFRNMNINVTNVHIGTDEMRHDNPTYYTTCVMALGYLQYGIKMNGHHYLSATVVHYVDMLNPLTLPSQAEFKEIYRDSVAQLLKAINGTRSRFAVSIIPFQLIIDYDLDVEFGFMDNTSNFTITDANTGLIYTNAFQFIYDSYLAAITKLGATPEIEIEVSKIGWPTDGHPLATLSNAERFYKGILPHIKSNKGTPLKPGASIDAYILNIADENMQNIQDGGPYQRHWGIYKSNGESKFKIDLSGEGRDIYPTVARGIVSMPKRWCVFNGDKSNLTRVKEQFDFVCQKADCTSLSPGGSCGNLNFEQNISYAFNNYFQMRAQYNKNGSSSSCDFNGLGTVVTGDPSVGICEFMVEIL
ncbi:hypothetical protein M569_15731, partial [Genlisea aurea]